MIDFDNPWMLLGLLAALVPLAVHLFGRRKAPVVQFSALQFILTANPRQARALQVSEWVLIAVRTLAVALIALALAKPMLPILGDAEGLEAAEGPVALVVVLDDSMSTMARSGGDTLFERARARAVALVERLPTGSQVAAVASGSPARSLVRQLTSDRGAVLDALVRLDHHPRKDDATRALELAAALLTTAGDLPRRVVVLTDLQQSGWQGVQPPWQPAAPLTPAEAKGPPVLRIDRLEPASRENTAIVDATATPATERGPNQVRVEVALQHHGEKPFRNYLTLRVGDRELKSLVQLQPGESLRRSYVLPASAPVAEILLPDDGLPADNRRLLRLDGGAAVRVALVNGAPRPVPRDDEVFFAARALELSTAHAGEIAVDTLQLPGLTPASLHDYDVIVLANVGELPADLVQGLGEAVRAGKGLLVTLGDNLPEDPPGFLPGLLPSPLQGLRSAGVVGVGLQPQGMPQEPSKLPEPERGSEPTRTPLPSTMQRIQAAPRKATPSQRPRGAVALRLVADGPGPLPVRRLRQQLAVTVGEALADVAVVRYGLVEPSPSVSEQVILRYEDGAPALLLTPHGRGLVALLTTSVDRDWADLPLQPGFLPLLHDVAVALAGERGQERRSAVEVGEVAVLSRDERADQLELRLETPGAATPGLRATRRLSAAAQRGQGWQVVGLAEPGRYTATEQRAGVALTSRTLIVVPPGSESNLAPLAGGPLEALHKGIPGGQTRRPKAPGWTAVLLVLFGLLVFEGVVLARDAWRGRGVAA